MNDPNYVRLANRLSRSIIADVTGSGWSISGLDVLPFPKSEAAQRFVRAELRDGKLEPAGKAEYEEVQESHKAVSDASHQEADVQNAALEANAKLIASREAAAEEDDEFEDEDDVRERDTQARLDAQAEDETDDPEEQASRNRTRPAAKVHGSKAKKKKNKAADA